MSAWKLVEAVPEEPQAVSQKPQHEEDRNNINGRGGGRGGFRGGRGGGRGRGNYPQLSKQDRTYFAYMAVQQIELIFTPDNLCMDTYIRSYMDEAGYVPIALVCGYPHVQQFGALYNDIVARLQETCESERCVVEIDVNNETIRLKQGWDQWLAPNTFGGRGQPLYVKQPRQPRVHNNFNNNSNNNHISGSNNNSPNKKEQCFDPNADNQQHNWPSLAEQKTVQN